MSNQETTMSRYEELARVFQAAAYGAMEPFNMTGMAFNSSAYDAARVTAGALSAIAAVYRGLAEQEKSR
jgi:hypothetical protein